MAEHQSPCELCDKLKACDEGRHPGALLELPSGWTVLGDSQFFEGYSLLISRVPATELHELPDGGAQLLADMALLARAVWNVTKPHKLNYESLGNQVTHLHWHVFPRHTSEETKGAPVWRVMPQGDAAKAFALGEQHTELREKLKTELKRLLDEREDS